MKKLAALALATLTTSAMAAGSYDGIYMTTSGDVSFVTVHQNNNAMIIGGYGYVRTNGAITFYNSGQAFKPAVIQEWVAYGGTIEGSVATLRGDILHNACNATIQAHFSENLLTAQVTAIAPTQEGVSQNYPCWSVLPIGSMLQFKKVF